MALPAAAVVCCIFALCRPQSYQPTQPDDNNQISPYLTHVLAPQIYNGAQRAEPFTMDITEDGVNDIVARLGWPMTAGQIQFSDPQVFFKKDEISIMASTNMYNMNPVGTAAISAGIDEKGLLWMNINSVKIGVVDFTSIARLTARNMYNSYIEQQPDVNSIELKAAGALLDNKPFEPVFLIEDKKIRLDKVTITEKMIQIHFVPAQ